MANQAPVELIKKHLFYEVLMLGETRKKLREQDYSDHIAANAFIETFCIHARNLNEFLHENGRPDTLKASTFATADYERPLITDERRLLFAKINKQISHLTEGRTSVPQEAL
jgi:hypothetical protein